MLSGQEKRKTDRMEAEYEVFLAGSDSFANCRSKDVSVYGIGLVSDSAVDPGREVDVTIVVKEATANFRGRGVVRHCTPITDRGDEHFLGIEFTAGHEQGLPFLESDKEQFHTDILTSVSIDVDIDTCYKYLARPDKFPEWVSGVEGATVKASYPDGRPRQVEFTHNFFLKKVRYIDEYTYDDQNHGLSWQSVGGDSDLVKNVGGYTLRSLGPQRTNMAFHLDITIKFLPSKRIINYFSTILVRKEMKNFKLYVEKKVAGKK